MATPGNPTKATSWHGMVIIEGPADQAITLGFIISAVTPTSTAVRMNQQLNAQARMMGGRQLPLNLFVAPLTGPVAALNNLLPTAAGINAMRYNFWIYGIGLRSCCLTSYCCVC